MLEIVTHEREGQRRVAAHELNELKALGFGFDHSAA